ncbi:MAG: hypothetical protein ACK4E7_14640, partial [Permianibacter sp.]
MMPADDREEWLKEGFTDYLTTMTMARNGIDSQTDWMPTQSKPRSCAALFFLNIANRSVAAPSDLKVHRVACPPPPTPTPGRGADRSA